MKFHVLTMMIKIKQFNMKTNNIKILFVLICSCFLLSNLRAQSFYDSLSIQVVELYFSQPNWDYMMDTAKAGSGSYILADSIRINGTTLDSVGVKYKGNSSYNASQVKNPFHIELNHFKDDHIYDGITDIKLNNGFKDPTQVRETIAYDIARSYMSAPRANYARLYINNTYFGLYTNVESITRKFVFNHFGSKTNTFFKCNPIYSGGNKSNLAYLGADSSLYFSCYEIKSDFGWNDLVELCDIIKFNPNDMNDILDIDRVLWMLAFNNLLVNLDSYTGAISQNYYLYKADNGCFNAVVWDLNESFGSFNNTGIGPPLSVSQMQELSIWLHQNNTDRPLIHRLLNIPMYAKMYVAHFRTMYEEFFLNDDYYSLGTTYQALIDSSVQADVNKLYTYTQFQNNMTQTITSGPMNIPGLSLLMDGRKTFLSSQTDMQYVQPVISNIMPSNSMPPINDNVFITAQVQNANLVMLGYRFNKTERFVRVEMFDDGNNGDGSAGDGVYGVEIPVNSSQVQYYIYAENNNAGKFSPQRAEYEYYTLFSVSENIVAGEVVINELMAINSSTITDPNGQYEDWIELYNNTDRYISLNNVYLSDSYSDPYKWQFPDNTIIEPYGYLIIWADDDLNQSGLHANFKLSGSGENVVMSYDYGYYIDDISFGIQTADISYGRYPNGTGNFTFLAPTPLAFNQPLSVENITSSQDFKIYPNPVNTDITIVSQGELVYNIRICDIKGSVIVNDFLKGELEVSYNLSFLNSGIYIILINQKYPFKLIKQ